MQKILIFTTFLIVMVPLSLFSQTYEKPNGHIVDTLDDTEKVFSRMDIIPLFKGNMRRFLAHNISISLFLRNLRPPDSAFIDTARVKFIMSKKGVISNISISKAKSDFFKAEVKRLLRLSSCNWQIGQSSGRRLNGWAQFDVYLRLVRRNGKVTMNVDYKQYNPPEMPM